MMVRRCGCLAVVRAACTTALKKRINRTEKLSLATHTCKRLSTWIDSHASTKHGVITALGVITGVVQNENDMASRQAVLDGNLQLVDVCLHVA